MKLLILLTLSILFVSYVSSFNILVVFPYPGKSHMILGDGYVRHLLNAGHQVTYITAKPLKPHPNLKHVDVSSNIALFDIEKFLDFDIFLKGGSPFKDISLMYGAMMEIGNRSLVHKNVQKFLMESEDKYDVVISEWLYSELYCGFAAIFDVPYIWSSSMEPHPAVLSLIDEPGNPAYFPDHLSHVSLPLSLFDRAKEVWNLAHLFWIRWNLKGIDEKTFRDAFAPAAKKRGVNLPTLEELKYRSSLMLANSHVSSGEAQKLPQNYIPIAGYHIEDEVPALPKNFQKIMDEAENGVIYFSMGSMMQSKTWPNELKKQFLNMFGSLKQTVIWKFEEDLADVPKNVHIVNWAPQQGILAHPKCVLFVTHGGLLSTTEALHYGVPIIGIPLFADQHVNVQRSVNKGYALQVDLSYDTPATLKVAIQEIISNPKYRQRVKELSFIYHHRPSKPGATLVHWVEHVIQTKGAPHLQSPALDVPLYQKLYLDVIGLCLLAYYFIKQSLFSKKKHQNSGKKKKN